MKAKVRKLTVKQQRFVDFYDGNATEAAQKAGYKGNNATLRNVGAENLTKPYIRRAIRAREKKRNKPHIATREERQQFWSDVLTGKLTQPAVVGKDEEGNAVVADIPPAMKDRL